MIATIDDFTCHVAAHAGVPAPFAERVTRTVLAGIGGYLGPTDRRLVADELPGAFGAAVLAGSDRALPVEEHLLALGVPLGHAGELIASVYRVLVEELSTEALDAIRAAVPVALAAQLAASAPSEPPPPPPSEHPRDTLAGGRPGSHHPISDAHGPGAQSESIAADNPHAATKLSSATGVTQERRHETLAEGHPGPPSPISRSRR